MLLVISLIFVLVPLLGIAYIAVYGSITTVDGLFAALMLLAMAGIFALNVLLLLRKKSGASASGKSAAAPKRAVAAAAGTAAPGGVLHRGRVESVDFYEAPVGMPNKSVVMLSEGSAGERLLVVDGDVRNVLPVGRRVQLTLRREGGSVSIAHVQYA